MLEVQRPFPVANVGLLDAPFLGGFDLPRPQLIDIDGDGDFDLFVQETPGSVMLFENVGSPTNAVFRFHESAFRDLDVGAWYFFADLDADSDFDLLVEHGFGLVRVLRNVGTRASAAYEIWTDTLRDSAGMPVLTEPPSIPFVLDVDCNGKIDLMIGSVAGTISHYELVSEVGAVPVFDLVDDRYQDIEVVGGSGKGLHGADERHGANAMSFADVDGDSDPDLLWGDFFEPNVILFRNDGSCTNPVLFRATDAFLASGSEVFDTSGLNVPRPVDIDGDGDRDLVVGVMGGAFVPSTTSVENLYLLDAEGGDHILATKRLLPTVDVGSNASPFVGDIDGDGDLDLLIGNTIDPAEPVRGSITLYRNNGTADAPRYSLADTDLFSFDAGFSPVPASSDIDADGDTDLFFGMFKGEVVMYENVGSSTSPSWRFETDTFLGVDVGAESAPEFGDIDGDGDVDLLVGESSGLINLFRNTGTAAVASFSLESESFAGIDVGQRSRPRLVDYDGDTDLDLFVGSADGRVHFFRNEGSVRDPVFVSGQPAVAGLVGAVSPAAGDVDGDGDIDLLVGTVSGGARFYRNEVVPTSAGPKPLVVERWPRLITAYPNPADDLVSVEVYAGYPGSEIRLDVVDVLGRIVHSVPVPVSDGYSTVTLDVRALTPGAHVLRVTAPRGAADTAVLVVI